MLTQSSGLSIFPVTVEGREGLQFALRANSSDRTERPVRGIIFADQNKPETVLGNYLVRLDMEASSETELRIEFGQLIKGKVAKPSKLVARLQASGKHYFCWVMAQERGEQSDVGAFFKARKPAPSKLEDMPNDAPF